MSNCRFLWDNVWDVGNLSSSSFQAKFPSVNTQEKWITQPWRSNYGNNSGWGNFVINSGNNKLYFDEGSGEVIATISIGTYDTTELSLDIETQMKSVGTHDYSVEYIDSENKFKITDNTGTFKLYTFSSNIFAIWDTIGFDTTTDTSYASYHQSDYIRIHTEEWIKINNNSKEINAIFLLNCNISTSAILKIEFSFDDFSNIPFYYSFSSGQKGVTPISGRDFVVLLDTPLNYQYVRIYIQDKDNSDGYIQIGRIFMGSYFEPTHGFEPKFPTRINDTSTETKSEGSESKSILLPILERRNISFKMANPIEDFDRMHRDRGKTRELIFFQINFEAMNYDDVADRFMYCKITSYNKIQLSGNKQTVSMSLEEIR